MNNRTRLALFFLGFVFALANPHSLFGADPERHTHQASDGVNISYTFIAPQSGTAKNTVMIFPGMAMNARPFFAAAQRAAQSGSEVFILEPRYSHHYSVLPGQNPSSQATDIIDIDFAELLNVVSHLATTREIHWIGHSMGGFAALSLATRGARNFFRPCSLTLLSTGDHFEAMHLWLQAMNKLTAIGTLFSIPPWIHLVPLFSGLPGHGNWGSIPIDLGREMGTSRLSQMVETKNLKTPTLVVVGAFDEVMSVQAVKEFYDRIPTDVPKHFATIPGTHFSILGKWTGLSQLWPLIENHLSACQSKSRFHEHGLVGIPSRY